VKGEQSHDNEVLTAIMVRTVHLCGQSYSLNRFSGQALNVVIRMEPSLRYPFKGRSFYTSTKTQDPLAAEYTYGADISNPCAPR
jgi:hypothetical protein